MKLTVIAAVLDEHRLTMYTADGSTEEIPQGDRRLKAIVDQLNASPPSQGNPLTIEIEGQNVHAQFDAKAKGFGIQLFRVAKAAVKHLFQAHKDEIESIPGASWGQSDTKALDRKTAEDKARYEEREAERKRVLAEARRERAAPVALGEGVLKDAVSVQTEAHNSKPLTPDETIVAVTKTGKILPGVEKLTNHLNHAIKEKNPAGVMKLIERLAAMVADSRGHSAEDVLRFMERGDLQPADNGDIIAYKVLKTTPGHKAQFKGGEGIFFDLHSGNIPQRVGTEVRVAEHLVDKNRKNECSNGLHVARRGYLGSFYGDVCVMIRMKPEDIIAVPHGDANKVRVCAYTIIAQLTKKQHDLLRSNQPMTSEPEAAALLGKAIRGELTPILEVVHVNAQYGGDIHIEDRTNGQIETLSARAQANAVKVKNKDIAQAKKAVEDVTSPKLDAAPVDPKASKKVQAEKAPITPKGETRSEKAAGFYKIATDTTQTDVVRVQAAQALITLKKSAKVSWGKLGFNTGNVEAELNEIIELGATAAKPVEPKKVTVKVQSPVEPAATAPKKEEPKVLPLSEMVPMQLYTLLADEKGNSYTRRKAIAEELQARKKAKKKAYTAFGLPADTADLIAKILG